MSHGAAIGVQTVGTAGVSITAYLLAATDVLPAAAGPPVVVALAASVAAVVTPQLIAFGNRVFDRIQARKEQVEDRGYQKQLDDKQAQIDALRDDADRRERAALDAASAALAQAGAAQIEANRLKAEVKELRAAVRTNAAGVREIKGALAGSNSGITPAPFPRASGPDDRPAGGG